MISPFSMFEYKSRWVLLLKTMLKPHTMHSSLQIGGEIDQFRLHSPESGTLHPYVQQLQAADVSRAYFSAIDAYVFLTHGNYLL